MNYHKYKKKTHKKKRKNSGGPTKIISSKKTEF